MLNEAEIHKMQNIKEDKIQLVVFSLAGQEFGVDIQQVKKVVKTGMISPVPDSPDFIKGMANVRGEIVLAIDPKIILNLAAKNETTAKHIIITKQENNIFGLLADEAVEVLRIAKSEIKPPPKFVMKIDKMYLQGVVTVNERIIIILDLSRVLAESELLKLASESGTENSVHNDADQNNENMPQN